MGGPRLLIATQPPDAPVGTDCRAWSSSTREGPQVKLSVAINGRSFSRRVFDVTVASPAVVRSMERKRRVPARAAAREEASNKKRATPELVKVATPEALPPAPPPQPKPEPLPTSYIPGRPLPTLDKPFLAPLLPAQWQTIAER